MNRSKPRFVGATLVVAAVVAAGCSSGQNVAAAPTPEVVALKGEVSSLQDSMRAMDAALQQKETEAQQQAQAAAEARAELNQALAGTSGNVSGATGMPASMNSDLLPPGATAGQCFARVFSPQQYRTVSEQVMVRDSTVSIEVIPARYESGEERVLVREASTRLEVVPAEYGWAEERVTVRPASKRLEEIPAVYDWVEERVLDKPEHTVWKKGRGAIERVDEATGEIMCLVTVPATYKTIRKRVMVQPPTTREVDIPAEYETVRKRVVAKPATTREVTIPAEYKTVSVRKLAQPARQTRSVTPPVYETVTRQELAAEGQMEWRPILCETNVTPSVIRGLQRALQSAGHNPGPIDGVIGRQTMSAVRSYQRANRLPTGGLTIQTLEKLNVNLATDQ